MRILFTTWAWPSHLFPLVPFAWTCGAAGHDVCIASQPALTDAITKSGLPAMRVGRDSNQTTFAGSSGNYPAAAWGVPQSLFPQVADQGIHSDPFMTSNHTPPP
jgi:hypothetical protein